MSTVNTSVGAGSPAVDVLNEELNLISDRKLSIRVSRLSNIFLMHLKQINFINERSTRNYLRTLWQHDIRARISSMEAPVRIKDLLQNVLVGHCRSYIHNDK
jgi:hypothetical protein